MPELPTEFDSRYELLEKLGEGGMGSVYKVRHRLLGQLRVIKLIRPHHADDPQVLARFRREAKAAIDLRHPNVAQIHDFWLAEDGRALLVMELIEGLTFQRLLARKLPPLALTIEMARQSLAALGYLHSKGYLHRDVAPDNLMLTRSYDGRPSVKLIDLGLIKRDAETLELTATNIFVGKIRYASPELFRRPAMSPKATSDLYSFASVLYEMLTGVCPAQGSSFEELMTAHLLDPPPSFDETDPEGRVPDGLRQVVLRALEKRPSDRFQSAEAFAEALEPFHDPDAVPDFAELESIYGTPWLAPSIQRESVRPAESMIPTLAAGQGQGQGQARPATSDDPTDRLTGPEAPASGVAWRVALGLILVAVLFGGWAGLRWWLETTSMPSASGATPETVEATEAGPTLVALSQGRLSLDARPWAEILGIEDADGRSVAFAGPLYTPAILTLSPGEYTVVLGHPEVADPVRAVVRVPLTGTLVESVAMVPLAVEDFVVAEGLAELLAPVEGDPS